jgi:hypothetical protein
MLRPSGVNGGDWWIRHHARCRNENDTVPRMVDMMMMMMMMMMMRCKRVQCRRGRNGCNGHIHLHSTDREHPLRVACDLVAFVVDVGGVRT